MAKLDIKKMKAKLAQSKQRGKGGMFWKPKDGKQDIRIVPTADGDPFKNYFFHYNVGEQGFLCPKRNFNEDCAVCDFAHQLYKDGDEESIKMAKEISAKQRFFSPVIVRGDEDAGIKVYGYSKTVYEEFLGLVLNPDFGDITDVDNGVDLTLQYGKESGAQFPSTGVTPRRKSSELLPGKSAEEVKELLDSVPDFDELYDRVSSADARVALDKHLAGDEGEVTDEGDDGTEKYGSSTASDEGGGASSVDSAFEQLS